MVVRDLSIGDLVELEKKAQFPVDNLINKPIVTQKTFEDECGLIGSIIVNRTVELIAIFNDNRSTRDLYNAMVAMYNPLHNELTSKGYRDIHAFVKDDKFADILVKHFNFEDVVGRALVRRY